MKKGRSRAKRLLLVESAQLIRDDIRSGLSAYQFIAQFNLFKNRRPLFLPDESSDGSQQSLVVAGEVIRGLPGTTRVRYRHQITITQPVLDEPICHPPYPRRNQAQGPN